MVGLIIAFPNIVSGGLATKAKIDIQNIQIQIPVEESTPGGDSGGAGDQQEDTRKALERSMEGGDKSPDTGGEKAPEEKK
jgi:hypothetical protein